MMFAPDNTNLMAPVSTRRRGIMSGYCRAVQQAVQRAVQYAVQQASQS